MKKISDDQIKQAADDLGIDLVGARKLLKTAIDPSDIGVSSLMHHPKVQEGMRRLMERNAGLQDAFMVAFTMMSKLGPDRVVLCVGTENTGSSIVQRYWFEILDEKEGKKIE